MTDNDPAADVETRRAELAANLDDLDSRVQAACEASGRDRVDLTVIAVTKTFPAADVRLLAGLGVGDVGENRDQEAAGKFDACADLALRWHFVGRLQRNKCRSVARYADVVHSVDRVELVDALSAAACARERDLTALVQVSFDPETRDSPVRGGVRATAALSLADRIAAAPGLVIGGVMAVAPLGEDPNEAFARLAEVSAAVQRHHPDATIVSAGMSGDLEAAVRRGATHLRVGTALLGRRTTPVR
jgi:pyridoxal phosphate enzyme (YggS family)